MHAPSSDFLAAGTLGLSVGGVITSAASAIPGSAWSTIGSGLIGLAVVWIKSSKEAKASVIEVKFLRERVRDLEIEAKLFRPAPPSPPNHLVEG